MSWSENEHIIIESHNADGELQMQVVVEEAGDAKKKVLHINVERSLDGKVVVHL